MHHNDDPLFELIEDDIDPPRPSASFRDAMIGQTTGLLRRRRRIRGAAIAFSVVFIYGAGVETALLMQTSEDDTALTTHMSESIIPPTSSSTAQPKGVPVAEEVLHNWEALSIRVEEASPAEKVRLLQAAGDWHMEESDDIESAASCYGAMFAAMETETMLVLNEKDNWLLASLKLARLKEKSHDQKI